LRTPGSASWSPPSVPPTRFPNRAGLKGLIARGARPTKHAEGARRCGRSPRAAGAFELLAVITITLAVTLGTPSQGNGFQASHQTPGHGHSESVASRRVRGTSRWPGTRPASCRTRPDLRARTRCRRSRGNWGQRDGVRGPLEDADRRLRYFTPEREVDLCGHATIAAHAYLFERAVIDDGTYTLETAAGTFDVELTIDGTVWMEQANAELGRVDVDEQEVADALASTWRRCATSALTSPSGRFRLACRSSWSR